MASRSKTAFLNAARKQGLTARQATRAYGAMRDRLGRDPLKADITRHPRMMRDATKKATAPPPPSKKKAAAKKKPTPKKAPPKKVAPKKKAPPKKKPPTKKPPPKKPPEEGPIDSIGDWLEDAPYEDYDAIDEEWDASATYEFVQ